MRKTTTSALSKLPRHSAIDSCASGGSPFELAYHTVDHDKSREIFGDMLLTDAMRSMRLFATEVMPKVAKL